MPCDASHVLLTRVDVVRDTSGTALYFLEYDSLRHLLGRLPSGEQGDVPSWFPIHPSLLPFFCGSFAGVSSWALIYPVDVYAVDSFVPRLDILTLLAASKPKFSNVLSPELPSEVFG